MVPNFLGAWRKHRGLSQDDLAEAIGTTKSMYGKLERGERTLDTDWLAKLAKALDCEPFELISLAPGDKLVPTAEKFRHGDVHEPSRKPADQSPTRDASEGETTPIISLDLSLSMGPGTPIEDFVEESPVEFDIGLLRSITRSPYHRLRVIKGVGTSMEPKFYTGDRILVDTTERALSRIDGYYWITLWGAHGLKRLRPASRGQVEVISENREFDPIVVDADELTIEGRAIWFARDL